MTPEELIQLAQKIEAEMRKRTPEQAAMFLSLLLTKIEASSLEKLNIEYVFTMAEDITK